MNEIEQRLEEIRARVAATTKDDWSACGYPREGLIPAYWAVMSGGAVVAIARPGFGRPGEDEANAWFIAWAKPDLEFLMDRIARLTAELRATKTALEDTRTDRARVGLETRKAAQQESAAEVERLRTLIDAIVTGPGEQHACGEGLRVAAEFAKTGCQACDLADELRGQADDLLLTEAEKREKERQDCLKLAETYERMAVEWRSTLPELTESCKLQAAEFRRKAAEVEA